MNLFCDAPISRKVISFKYQTPYYRFETVSQHHFRHELGTKKATDK